jgi:isocitrate/isopropylmalate dehydrogenase
VDIVVIRENHEDLYAGIEFEEGSVEAKRHIDLIEELTGRHVREDSGFSIKPISIFGSERIVNFAGSPRAYPDIEFNDRIVDNCAMACQGEEEPVSSLRRKKGWGYVDGHHRQGRVCVRLLRPRYLGR